MQGCSNSIANTLELLQSCTKPLICVYGYCQYRILTRRTSSILFLFLLMSLLIVQPAHQWYWLRRINKSLFHMVRISIGVMNKAPQHPPPPRQFYLAKQVRDIICRNNWELLSTSNMTKLVHDSKLPKLSWAFGETPTSKIYWLNVLHWNPSRATPSRAATPLVRPYFQAPLYFSYISFKCQPLMNSHPTNLVRGQWFWFQPPLTSSHSAAARSGQPWNSWLIWL